MATARLKKEFTLDDLETRENEGRNRGWRERDEYYKSQVAELARQKAQLEIEQTKAVTDLLRAAGENLSKAGYLIGKLNKDTSR